MPPKRKATTTAPAEPPTKRVTRQSARATTQPAPAKPAPTRASRRPKAAQKVVVVESEDDEEEAAEEPPQPARTTRATARRGRGRGAARTQPARSARPTTPEPTRRRGRPPAKKKEIEREATPEPPQATSSRVTIEALQQTIEADADESDDELLLKGTPPRPSTPPRKTGTGTNIGTPRMVLDAVEVPTPSKKMRDIQNLASPRVTSPAKAASPVKRFPQRETTPTRPVQASAPKSSPLRLARPQATLPTVHPLASTTTLPATPTKSPHRGKGVATPQASPSRLPRSLPASLQPCLEAQKRATLKALQEIPVFLEHADGEEADDVGPSTNELAYQQLVSLLKGTVERGEGNSCMVVGPKGSGKTQLVERAIATLSESPIVIRLSGHAQTNDRLAIREIAWQLAEQTGHSLLPDENDEPTQDNENPFIEAPADTVVTLPPPSHLLALIAMLPTLARPTILVLDAFDLFALHARQSLLYCLLDTVQSCRAVPGNKGIAVVGVTPRVETVNILEKRVKSRFSGRILRTAGVPCVADWVRAARHALCAHAEVEEEDWTDMWENSVDRFLQDSKVLGLLRETYALTKDVRVLSRLLVSTVVGLKSSSPTLSAAEFAAAVSKQRCPSTFAFLTTLTYPALCLLIAATHTCASGHETFTFEMLHDAFRDQVRTSLSAPVQVDGGGIGMVRCSRDVLFGAFEKLVALRVFVLAAPAPAGTGREFVKYRCEVDRADVKSTVDKTGQLNLKKWLNKGQGPV